MECQEAKAETWISSAPAGLLLPASTAMSTTVSTSRSRPAKNTPYGDVDRAKYKQ